jgi:hypothetical protein
MRFSLAFEERNEYGIQYMVAAMLSPVEMWISYLYRTLYDQGTDVRSLGHCGHGDDDLLVWCRIPDWVRKLKIQNSREKLCKFEIFRGGKSMLPFFTTTKKRNEKSHSTNGGDSYIQQQEGEQDRGFCYRHSR